MSSTFSCHLSYHAIYLLHVVHLSLLSFADLTSVPAPAPRVRRPRPRPVSPMTLLVESLKSPPPASDTTVTTGRSFSPIACAIGKTAHIPSANVDRPRPRQVSTSTATTGGSFSPIAPAIGKTTHTRSADVDRPRPRQVSTSTVTTGRSFSPIASAIGKTAHSRFADVDAARLPPIPRVPRPNRFRDVHVRPVSCSLPTKPIPKGILKKSGAPSMGRRAVTWMAGDVEKVKVVDRWIKESEHAYEVR